MSCLSRSLTLFSSELEGEGESMSKIQLRWPDGQKRTRINLRAKRGMWKKTLLQYQAELLAELTKLGARNVVITGDAEMQRIDPGVAVYFSRPPAEGNEGDWQDVLGIDNPTPSVDEIDDNFKELARKYHPDNQTSGNYTLYQKIEEARRVAKAWVTGDFGKQHEKVIACDRYDEVRLNIKAIQITVAALRRIEESGAPGFLDRAMTGFTVPQIGESSHVSARA
jgi:hypothetical protein